MQGIIWNYEQKLLDNFRQTAKGKRDWFIFFEKSSDKKRFSTRDRGGYCVMLKEGRKVRSAKSEIPMRAWRAPHAYRFARCFCRDSGNITSDISHIIKKDPVIGFVSGAPLYFWFDCVWSKEACCKEACCKEACCKDPCDRVHIGCAFAPLIWLCLKQGSIDLGAQTAQGMCEVQIVWIICTSSIPAGTALTKAISIYYIDSMLLVNYSLKIC